MGKGQEKVNFFVNRFSVYILDRGCAMGVAAWCPSWTSRGVQEKKKKKKKRQLESDRGGNPICP